MLLFYLGSHRETKHKGSGENIILIHDFDNFLCRTQCGRVLLNCDSKLANRDQIDKSVFHWKRWKNYW